MQNYVTEVKIFLKVLGGGAGFICLKTILSTDLAQNLHEGKDGEESVLLFMVSCIYGRLVREFVAHSYSYEACTSSYRNLVGLVSTA